MTGEVVTNSRATLRQPSQSLHRNAHPHVYSDCRGESNRRTTSQLENIAVPRSADSEAKGIPAGRIVMYGTTFRSKPTYQTARYVPDRTSSRCCVAEPTQQTFQQTQLKTSARSWSNCLTPQELHSSRTAYRCLHPANARMRNTADRLRSFHDRFSHWPSHLIKATPEEMAEAGLYYLGYQDRVKCWYCGGGISKWEPNDRPWVEHAKWFPKCEFVLREKGPRFVTEVAGHQAVDVTSHVPEHALAENYDIPPPIAALSSNPYNEDSDRSVRDASTMVSTEFAQYAKDMGFDDDEIQRAALKRLREMNSPFTSFADLIQSLQSLSEG